MKGWAKMLSEQAIAYAIKETVSIGIHDIRNELAAMIEEPVQSSCNNKYFYVYNSTEEDVKNNIIKIIKSHVKKEKEEVLKSTGGNIADVCKCVNLNTIDVFFDINKTDLKAIMVEKN